MPYPGISDSKLSKWSDRRHKGFATYLGAAVVAMMSDTPSSFVVKEVAGQYRWVLISSSAFEDRDGEIVSAKALLADVDRADADGDYGPLRWWHIPGADIGDCDFNMLHGRMLYESGTFRDRRVAEAVKAHAGELGASIGFRHPVSEPDASGIFHNIRRFERSLLPLGVASNPFTAVSLVEKESQMTLIEDKLKAFGKILGGDAGTVAQVLAIGEAKEKSADGAGTRHKEKQVCEPGSHWDEATQACVKDKPDETAPPAAEDKKEYVGDMDPVALKALIVESVGGHIDARLDAVRAEFKAALETQATTKAAHDEAAAASLKAYNEKLDGIASSVKSALDGVAELKGELPRALGERLKGFHASTDGEAPPETLKDTAPALDPLAKHWAALHQSNGGQPPVSG